MTAGGCRRISTPPAPASGSRSCGRSCRTCVLRSAGHGCSRTALRCASWRGCGTSLDRDGTAARRTRGPREVFGGAQRGRNFVGVRLSGAAGAGVAALQGAALVLGQPAPDAGVLAGLQRPLQAGVDDLAATAHLFGVLDLLQGGSRVADGEEQLRVL